MRKNSKQAELVSRYRLNSTTTPESLAMGFSTVLAFGEFTLVAGYYYNPNGNDYYAAIYRFTTADHTCEGEVELVAVSAETFKDNGHAIAWAIDQTKGGVAK